jgi:hypothetical protein
MTSRPQTVRPARRALVLLALLAGVGACSSIKAGGLGVAGDGGAGDAAVDRPPILRTGSVPVPQSGDRSLAVWTCSGGGMGTAPGAQVGVATGAASGTAVFQAPSGSQVTLGHFVDTLE